MGNFARFGGMTWPMPLEDDDDSVQWRLRYGKPSREDILVAAAYMEAYGALVYSTQKKRNTVCKRLKEQENDPRK